jgi:hypothetical protein
MAEASTSAWREYRTEIVALHELAAEALRSGKPVQRELDSDAERLLDAALGASEAVARSCVAELDPDGLPIDERAAEKLLAVADVDLMLAGDAFVLDPELSGDVRHQWVQEVRPEDRARIWDALLSVVDELFADEEGGWPRTPLVPHDAPSEPGLLQIPAEASLDDLMGAKSELEVADDSALALGLPTIAGAAVDPPPGQELTKSCSATADEVVGLAAKPTFALVASLARFSAPMLLDELLTVDPTGVVADLYQRAGRFARRGLQSIQRFVEKLLLEAGASSATDLMGTGLVVARDQGIQSLTTVATQRVVHPILKKVGDYDSCLRQVSEAVERREPAWSDYTAISDANKKMLKAFGRQTILLGIAPRSSSFWAPPVITLGAPVGPIVVAAVYVITAGCVVYGLRARFDTLPDVIPHRRKGIPSTVSLQLEAS